MAFTDALPARWGVTRVMPRAWGAVLGTLRSPAVQQAVALVVGLRVALGLIAYAGLQMFPGLLQPVRPPYTSVDIAHGSALWPLLGPWERWDALEYQYIASAGYHPGNVQAVFFPLYPGLVHLVGTITGPGGYALAALLVSSLALTGALILLHRLVSTDIGRDVADRTLLYLCVTPTALFLVAGYTESLFLLLAVGSLYAARRRRFWVAGLCAGLAAVCRLQGVTLVVPLLWEIGADIRSRRGDGRSPVVAGHLAVLIPMLALAGWEAYVDRRLFPGGLSALNSALGHRGVFFSVPVIDGVKQALFHPLDWISVFLDLAMIALFVAMVPVMVRRMPRSYLLLALAAFVPMMVSEAPWLPVGSDGRYVLTMFPVTVGLAVLGRRAVVDRLVLVVFTPLLGLATVYFTHYGFVG